jgi:cyanophycinase
MLQIISQSQETQMSQATKTAILVIGGAEDKVHGKEILHTFWERSGGAEAIIGIIPSASREPTLIGERYHRIFEEMGAKELTVIDIRDRSQGEDPYYREFVEKCTGIFMTGGDQLRLCGLLADTPIMNRVLERVRLGEISIAGTSAGAAVMGYNMIAGGGSGESPNRSLVDMATGFGIIPEVVVDQHFHNRNRTARLLSAIASHPNHLGIGIDEDTCAMFERDGWVEIIGKGTVIFINTKTMTHTNQSQVESTEPLSLHNLQVSVLCHGDRYHLHKHQATAPKSGA